MICNLTHLVPCYFSPVCESETFRRIRILIRILLSILCCGAGSGKGILFDPGSAIREKKIRMIRNCVSNK
jgi:hypothetical protein